MAASPSAGASIRSASAPFCRNARTTSPSTPASTPSPANDRRGLGPRRSVRAARGRAAHGDRRAVSQRRVPVPVPTKPCGESCRTAAQTSSASRPPTTSMPTTTTPICTSRPRSRCWPDRPGVESLETVLGYRHSDYASAGGRRRLEGRAAVSACRRPYACAGPTSARSASRRSSSCSCRAQRALPLSFDPSPAASTASSANGPDRAAGRGAVRRAGRAGGAAAGLLRGRDPDDSRRQSGSRTRRRPIPSPPASSCARDSSRPGSGPAVHDRLVPDRDRRRGHVRGRGDRRHELLRPRVQSRLTPPTTTGARCSAAIRPPGRSSTPSTRYRNLATQRRPASTSSSTGACPSGPVSSASAGTSGGSTRSTLQTTSDRTCGAVRRHDRRLRRLVSRMEVARGPALRVARSRRRLAWQYVDSMLDTSRLPFKTIDVTIRTRTTSTSTPATRSMTAGSTASRSAPVSRT